MHVGGWWVLGIATQHQLFVWAAAQHTPAIPSQSECVCMCVCEFWWQQNSEMNYTILFWLTSTDLEMLMQEFFNINNKTKEEARIILVFIPSTVSKKTKK